MYELQLSYVYTFYNFEDVIDSDVRSESVKVENFSQRFKLYNQEDSSFLLSELRENANGKFVILTYPNKESMVISENAVSELLYDEYFNSMGDDNHNVYEGAIRLKKIENEENVK